jgi:hypothetical protein
VDGDRVVRSEGLRRLDVTPAVLFDARLSFAPAPRGTRGVGIALGYRWETDGRRSPRIAAEIPLGSSVFVRAARGGGPGRIGISVSAEIGRVAVSAGRMDDAAGGAITSAAIRVQL